MNTRKISVVLLALLLAAMVIVPLVSAVEQKVPATPSVDENIGLNAPEHYIPPEYFKDGKPAVPLPESEMMNLVLSEKTLDKFGQDKKMGIIHIPTSYLDLQARFTESQDMNHRFTEKNIKTDEPVVLIRMPKVMYERFLASSPDNNMTLPASNFGRHYKNLEELNSNLKLEGEVLTINPSEEDALMLEKLSSTPTVIPTPPVSEKTGTKKVNALLSPPGPNTWHNEWIHFTRTYPWNTYDYLIGQITPNTWWVSGNNNQYYSPQEREYYLNDGQDAIEIVVNYDHSTAYSSGKVFLFPAIYDNHSPAPIDINTWENPGEKIIQLNPGTFPHAYGYHVQIYNGKYYITFQDMSNGNWFRQYVYNDQDNPSTTFTKASGSVEFRQISNPITDTFYAYTTPVKDEWAHEVTILGSSWKKPRSVWSFNEQTPNENFVHISWAWGGSGNQDLITNSYLWSGWA